MIKGADKFQKVAICAILGMMMEWSEDLDIVITALATGSDVMVSLVWAALSTGI